MRPFLVFGLVFVVSGIAFKVGAAPFHMWIPDVYHGAPTPVTLIIGSGPKLAAFAMAVRLLVNGLLDLAVDWQQMLVDRKSTRLNSSHQIISYAVFCLKKKKNDK